MSYLFSLYWGICTLRRSPELAPGHPLFLVIVVVTDIALGTILSVKLNTDVNWLQALTYVCVNLASLATATWFLLYLKDLTQRFPSTLSAIIGCDVLLSVLLFLFTLFSGDIEHRATLGSILVIGLWGLWVTGFILHRALNLSMLVGILLAFAIYVFSVALSTAASTPVP